MRESRWARSQRKGPCHNVISPIAAGVRSLYTCDSFSRLLFSIEIVGMATNLSWETEVSKSGMIFMQVPRIGCCEQTPPPGKSMEIDRPARGQNGMSREGIFR
ncbi:MULTISPECIES: hypothetical protein [unclassified Microcoleus]|uniref:hypothetical protein n=1 Tax=unclassified Microcoleus TaxID=2642155 RepID=UPI002FD4A635